jgi:hypothetical protein
MARRVKGSVSARRLKSLEYICNISPLGHKLRRSVSMGVMRASLFESVLWAREVVFCNPARPLILCLHFVIYLSLFHSISEV